MASSSQVRDWWANYECDPSRYTKVAFPGEGRTWSLSVARESAPIWSAVAQIMSSEPYLFRESAGGTYNCRPPSLHSYALALDLNPSQNPMAYPVRYDYPETFIIRMEGIRANGHQALQWGGRWSPSNPPDTMHWQINVAPWDIDEVTWDAGNGGTLTWKKPGDPINNLTDADAALAYQGTFAPGSKEASYNPGNDSELNDRIWIVLGRITDWSMQIDKRLRAGGL
jgi:hypothetical protein